MSPPPTQGTSHPMIKSNRIVAWIAAFLAIVLWCLFLVVWYVSSTSSVPENSLANDQYPQHTDSQGMGDMTYDHYPTGTSTTSTTTTSSEPTTTGSPARRVSDRYIDLARPSTTRVGDAGLMPGTNIIVIKEKTEDRVISDSCTIAFSLPKDNGGYAGVTAGHCGRVGNPVYSVPTTEYFDSAERLGIITYVSSPGDYEGAGDWAVIDLDSDAQHPANSAQVPLRVDMSDRYPGDRLCKDGSRTGHGCGKKGEDDVIVNLGGFGDTGFSDDNSKVRGVMDQAFLCSLPGDSGSPIYDDEGIIGILSSSSATEEEVTEGECSEQETSRSYYSPSADVISQIERHVPDVGIVLTSPERSSQ